MLVKVFYGTSWTEMFNGGNASLTEILTHVEYGSPGVRGAAVAALQSFSKWPKKKVFGPYLGRFGKFKALGAWTGGG